VLIVDDAREDADLIVQTIERDGYTVVYERVHTAKAMRSALTRPGWDLVLSDYTMRNFSAVAALQILRETASDLPCLIISGTAGEETAVAALKAGARDFFVKGRLSHLVRAIERELGDAGKRPEECRREDAPGISEVEYRSLLEHSGFGMFESTLDGRLLAVNSALVKMLGYDSADDLLRTQCANLYVDPAARAALVRLCLEQGHIAGAELVWKRKAGDEIRVRLSGRLRRERDPQDPVFQAIVEDVTEHHRLQDQLRQAQKMEAVGQLAGGVAHDFNNMLTAILGYAELLTEQIGPEKPIGADLRQIQAAAERAAALTRQLLAFSRKQVLALAPLDLSSVVSELEPMLRRLIDGPIRIDTKLAVDLCPVIADATQLEHMLINLAVNARDAMPRGGVLTISTGNVNLDASFVATHRGSNAGSFAVLSVTDTGVGMSPEIVGRIFEPFFTTKARGQGTGLGLAAVYGTVKQLGGYIGVESVPMHGTTFTVYLPATLQPVARPAASRALKSPPVGRETVLLVEDEAGVRAFAKTALRRFGYRIVEAESAESALKLVEHFQDPIHLLLTDLVLPGENGCELAVRLTSVRPEMRVLFMSGYASALASVNEVLASGAPLLEKPFTALVLLTKTRQALGTAIESARN
jgi:hypothetical protein